MKVRDIMSAPVVTVREDTPLAEIARLMIDRRIGGVPVVGGDGRLVGIVTESDFSAEERGVPFSLLRLPQLFGHWVSRDNLEAVYEEARNITAGQVMTRKSSPSPRTIPSNPPRGRCPRTTCTDCRCSGAACPSALLHGTTCSGS